MVIVLAYTIVFYRYRVESEFNLTTKKSTTGEWDQMMNDEKQKAGIISGELFLLFISQILS